MLEVAGGRTTVGCKHLLSAVDVLSATNGQLVTVGYDKFSDFGRVFGYNVHSVDMRLANGYHLVRRDFAASPVVASEESGSAGEDDGW